MRREGRTENTGGGYLIPKYKWMLPLVVAVVLSLAVVAPAGAQVAGGSYTVQPGDNLSSISQRAYGFPGGWVCIWNANNWIANPNFLYSGWQLNIPSACYGYRPPSSGGGGGTSSGGSGAVVPGQSYTAQSGDNLSTIAFRAYGEAASWACIWAANQQIANPSFIYAGEVIQIPTAGTCGDGHPNYPRYHTVLYGESLTSIACLYYLDCNWQRIYAANHNQIANPSVIYAGENLLIP